MSESDTASMLQFALDLADEADEISMRYYRGELGTEQKRDGSLVTLADKEVEAHLRARIEGRFPEHAILGEEEGLTREGASARWVLDPIDGTHGFARALPVWATLIGLERDGVFEVGVASAPALGTRWWAGRGLGAYRADLPARGHAGTRIHVSDVATIEEAQILYGSYELTVDSWPGTDALFRQAWRTRGLGDFWGHCLVADGSAEAMLEGTISPWDIGALIVIVEEAGGRLTDNDGVATIDAGHCITTNGALHDAVLQGLQQPS
ncbi:MAG: histidinol-phosphatase [Dehalococcoidia bacterium]|nr:histidinol-phosphatase [Dehalococcoidia bacterium]